MPTAESGEPFPPGSCHFPQLGEEFFRQLTAEQLIAKLVKGYRKTEWQKMRGAMRHWTPGSMCAQPLRSLESTRFQEQHWAAVESQIRDHAMTTPPPSQTPSPAAQQFDRSARPTDSFHRVDNKPRWLGDPKNWFDR